MSKGTTVYICADGTLTYGPYGGRDKIVPQALPIAIVTDPDEAEDLITLVGTKAWDVPEADPDFTQQMKGRTIQPGYGPTHRYYYSLPEWQTNDVTTLPAVRTKVAAMLDLIRKRSQEREHRWSMDDDGDGDLYSYCLNPDCHYEYERVFVVEMVDPVCHGTPWDASLRG